MTEPPRDPNHDPSPDTPPDSPLPPRSGPWLFATLVVSIAIVAVQLYPYRFAAGSPPFLGLYHAGYLAVLGQITLFVPLGFVETQLARRLFGFTGGALAVLVALDGAVLALICQSVQYWMPDRTSSLIDLAANTLGTVVGYKLSLLLGPAPRAP